MRKVRDNSAVPKGGTFIYVHDEGTPSEFVQKHPYFEQLKQDVRAYKLANHLPIGLLFEEEYEANVCRHAAGVTCIDVVPQSELEKMTSLERGLAKRAVSGLKVRTAEQVTAIRNTCHSCVEFRGEHSFLQIACHACGCTKKRLYMIDEHCPINIW